MIALKIFDALVTMTDGEYPVAGDYQVGIHQPGQSPDDDMTDIRRNQAQALSVEITNDGAVVISFARAVLTKPVNDQRRNTTLLRSFQCVAGHAETGCLAEDVHRDHIHATQRADIFLSHRD